MTVQTTFTTDPRIGIAGMIYDSGPKDVVSCIAQGPIPFGAAVKVSDQYCVLPSASADITAGEVGIALVTAETPTGGAGYVAGDIVPVMKRGRVWVATEQAIASQADAFVRFSANGSLAPGSIRADADTAKAVALPKASMYRGVGGAGLGVLQLDYPGI